MFCMYCGEKVPDGARFCGKCGKQISDIPQPKTSMISSTLVTDHNGDVDSQKSILLKLMGVCVLWSMVAGFIPLIEGSIPFTLSVEWSFINLWKDVEVLGDIGVDTGFFIIVCAICGIFFLAALLCGGYFLYEVLNKNYSNKDIVDSALGASVSSMLATLTLIIAQAIINVKTEEYMMGMSFLSVLPIAWISIIISLLNIFVFASQFKKNN